MALQLGQALVNSRAAAMVTAAGGAELRLYGAAKPANAAAAEPGSAIATGTLPATALSNSNGTVTKLGTWTVTGTAAAGAAPGTAALSFRIYSGATCVMQGEVTDTAGAGPLKMDNTSIATGQTATATAFTIDDTAAL